MKQSIEEIKMIAEFDGYIIAPHLHDEVLGDAYWRHSDGANFYLSKMKYHTSWDWLMPVVEKIEAIKDNHHGHFAVYIGSNVCTIQATNLRTNKPMADPPHYYSEVVHDTKLSATWLAVIAFITWYSSTQQK